MPPSTSLAAKFDCYVFYPARAIGQGIIESNCNAELFALNFKEIHAAGLYEGPSETGAVIRRDGI